MIFEVSQEKVGLKQYGAKGARTAEFGIALVHERMTFLDRS